MSHDAHRGRHGLILLAPIALAGLLGLVAAVSALVFLARWLAAGGLSLRAGLNAFALPQETSNMESMLAVPLTLGLVVGFLVALIVLGVLLLGVLFVRRPQLPAGPSFPMPPFPMPPLTPGFDPVKFMECLCGAIKSPGHGGQPPFGGPPDPRDVAGWFWRELERLRQGAEEARRETERWKGHLDKAVADAGTGASNALKEAQQRTGEFVATLQASANEIESVATPFVKTVVENLPRV